MDVPEKEREFDAQDYLEGLEAKEQVMRLFFADPYTEYSLSEVAELTGKSKSVVSRAIRQLQDELLLSIVEKRYALQIQANHDRFTYKKRKIVYNLDVIYRSGIVEELLDTYPKAKAVVFFGSARKGEDSPGSDIDIAVETREEEQTLQTPTVKNLEDFLDRKVNIRVFDRDTIEDGLFSNIANGMVLFGYLEARP